MIDIIMYIVGLLYSSLLLFIGLLIWGVVIFFLAAEIVGYFKEKKEEAEKNKPQGYYYKDLSEDED